MALSVLQIGPNSGYCLFDSEANRTIMKGSETEIYEAKHTIETGEQMKATKAHYKYLRRKYTRLLMSAGYNRKEANRYLCKEMPFLFEPELGWKQAKSKKDRKNV